MCRLSLYQEFDTEDIDICSDLRIGVICAELQLANQFQCTTPNNPGGGGNLIGRCWRSSQESESIPHLSLAKVSYTCCLLSTDPNILSS